MIYISAACAFITRDQPLSSPRQLSAQARSHSQIQGASTTYLSSAGGRSRLPFEDVLKLTSKHFQLGVRWIPVDMMTFLVYIGFQRKRTSLLAKLSLLQLTVVGESDPILHMHICMTSQQ